MVIILRRNFAPLQQIDTYIYIFMCVVYNAYQNKKCCCWLVQPRISAFFVAEFDVKMFILVVLKFMKSIHCILYITIELYVSPELESLSGNITYNIKAENGSH